MFPVQYNNSEVASNTTLLWNVQCRMCQSYCSPVWEGGVCFPPTSSGHVATLPCRDTDQTLPGAATRDIQHSSQKTLYSEIKLTQVRKCSQSPQRFLNFVLFLDQTWTNLHVLFMIRLAGEEQYKRRCLAGVVTRFCSLNGSWSQLDLALNSTCFTPGGGAGHHHHHHSVPLLIYFVGVLCNGVTLPRGNQTNLTI